MPQQEIGKYLYVFRKDSAAREAVIWAHGISSNGTFDPGSKTIHFYVPEGWLFRFVKTPSEHGSFRRLMNNDVDPVNSYGPGSTGVPNYKLTKAAGTHITTKAARMTYDELEIFVRQGLVHFDIISVRNRFMSPTITLQSVIQATPGYDVYHCYFCRAPANGGKIQGQAVPRKPLMAQDPGL
jgi:hypothetical protein